MKNLKHIILFIFICLLLGCKKKKYNFFYDKTLVETLSFKLDCSLFDISKNMEKLDTINFYKLKNGMEVLAYCKTNQLLINFFEKNKVSNKMLYYGEKIIRENKFYLFSFEDKNSEPPYKKTGFLAIKNSNSNKITFVKVFESEMESAAFFRSFYSNNYLLLLNENDESYDVLDENHTKKIDENFCVLKITENGNIVLLNEEESEIILKSEFKLE